jgi:uncharacterized protein YdhG (YjbR/CyaY superfamily)/deoxyadenosine/deoxycytidine kinase
MMAQIIAVIGPSGVGKTSLVYALARTRLFQTAYEQHAERPFQSLFKQDKRYALANQMDYLLLRAEQERELRASPDMALMDGGLDLDFHGFTRLFHARGWLTDPEFDLCRRFYTWTRELLPFPDLIVALSASEETIRKRLDGRNRVNIASAEDAELLNQFVEEWLGTIHPSRLLRLDVSEEDVEYSNCVTVVLEKVMVGGWSVSQPNKRQKKGEFMDSNKVGFSSIDEYISTFPEEIQKILEELRATIKASAPDAEEKISYQMPTFALNGTFVHFAAFKNHIGLYPTPSGTQAFKRELSIYQGGKGSIKFPVDKPLPLKLISKIVKFRVAENLKKDGIKSGKKK